MERQVTFDLAQANWTKANWQAVAFARRWVEWVDRGAPEWEPFSRGEGLCVAAKWGWPALLKNRSKAVASLRAIFGTDYPFGGEEAYYMAAPGTMHEDVNRVAFARALAALPLERAE